MTLAQVLGRLPRFYDENLLVGTESSDDAAVYRISDELATIQTLDFFTPVVDDPYDFGRIAAANSLSDVYAMGGEPKIALNIAAFPNCLPAEILGEILRGGADKVMEAGAVLAGGHTIQDDEPKYGLSVTGFGHPDRLWKNTGAQEGDFLILTKPLGTGILTTAVKAELASEEEQREAVEIMATLNKYARDAVRELRIHACTDVTGFGLAGHALEMARGSGKSLLIHTKLVPILESARLYASMGLVPQGAYRNRDFAEEHVSMGAVELAVQDILFDPQTSGGLLLSIAPEDAKAAQKALSSLNIPSDVIGQVTDKKEKWLYFD